ncbi:MAG: DUF6070 family protein [Lachnospiraceae bacterium]|nr:DUF6070 family protein [Lachnospiraceae bacterium]
MPKKKIITCFIICLLVLFGYAVYQHGENRSSEREETDDTTAVEDSDYQIKYMDMTQRESDLAKKKIFTAAGKCRDLYETEAKGQECSVDLEEETVHQMMDVLASPGYAVTCGEYDSNMKNYEEVNRSLENAKNGQDAQAEFYAVHSGGIFLYYRLEFHGKKLWITSSSAFFDDNMKLSLNYLEKIQVYQWEYTKKGWLIWEKARSRNQEMDMHVFYRILPLDAECRELAKKCVIPISYFCNNLFSVNWDEKDTSQIYFNDLFDVLYAMENGDYPREDQYAGGVPKDVFESLIQKYFSISTETLRKQAGYNADRETYTWVEINGYHHSPMLKPVPEVVKCVKNPNGTITADIEAILPEDGTDCAFRHKVTIREHSDGTWTYVSNEVDQESVREILNYQPRCLN